MNTSIQPVEELLSHETSIHEHELQHLTPAQCEALEAAIGRSLAPELRTMAASACQVLAIPKKRWNWRAEGEDRIQLRLLTAIVRRVARNEEITPRDDLLRDPLEEGVDLGQVVETLSYYSNPHVPWTSAADSELVFSCLSEVRELFRADEFVDLLKPNLLKLSSSPTKKQESKFKITGLRPQLGFSIAEDKERQNWKESTKVKSLSMIWLLISLFRQDQVYEKYWPIVTSFILHLLDDPQPLFKAQGCFILSHFMTVLEGFVTEVHLFTKTGLAKLLSDSVKNCLTYLPQMTPSDESLYLLSAAFPPLYKLVSIGSTSADESCKNFIEVLNEGVLSSIHHIQGYDDALDLHIFLLQQAGVIIERYLKQDIFVSLNKLNRQLNFTIMNPLTVDRPKGLDLVLESIKIQHLIIDLVVETHDNEAYELLLAYKYDFLAAWTIIITRLKKTSYEWTKIADEIRLCVESLESMGELADLSILLSKYPEIHGVITV